MAKVLSKREKIILYLTIGVIGLAIVYNIIIAPLVNSNDDLNKGIEVARAKLNKYSRLLGQKDTIVSKYSQFSAQFNLATKQDDRLIQVLAGLESIAKGANIRILDIRPQGEYKNSPSYNEIIIDLKAEGAMQDFMKFIYDVENSLFLLKIKRFQVSSKPRTQLLEGTFSISQLSLSE